MKDGKKDSRPQNFTHCDQAQSRYNKTSFEKNNFKVDNMMCTEAFNNQIGGDFFSNEFRFVAIKLIPCIGEEWCATK